MPWTAPRSELASTPSSSTKAIFTTTRNWVTWLFSTTASNSLAQTERMLWIVLEARCTAWRIASSKLSEDWPDNSMNLPTDMHPSLVHPAQPCSAQHRPKAIRLLSGIAQTYLAVRGQRSSHEHGQEVG